MHLEKGDIGDHKTPTVNQYVLKAGRVHSFKMDHFCKMYKEIGKSEALSILI